MAARISISDNQLALAITNTNLNCPQVGNVGMGVFVLYKRSLNFNTRGSALTNGSCLPASFNPFAPHLVIMAIKSQLGTGPAVHGAGQSLASQRTAPAKQAE